MIRLDVIKIVVNLLANHSTLSSYSLEYGTALLMNLSLRSEGKAKCRKTDLPILQVLNDLIEHENARVKSLFANSSDSVLGLHFC